MTMLDHAYSEVRGLVWISFSRAVPV